MDGIRDAMSTGKCQIEGNNFHSNSTTFVSYISLFYRVRGFRKERTKIEESRCWGKKKLRAFIATVGMSSSLLLFHVENGQHARPIPEYFQWRLQAS